MEKLKEKQEPQEGEKAKRHQRTAGSSNKYSQSDCPSPKGVTVRIKGQTSSVGEVLEINGKNAVVAFGSIKTTVKTERLERSNAVPQRRKESAKSSFVSNQTQDSMYEKKLNFKQDIDVRGMRGDEALQAVTYFVDDAILVGMEPGTHPTWDRYGNPAYPYPPIFANHTGSPPFCRRTYPIGRCRYHGSRFGIKKEEYEE